VPRRLSAPVKIGITGLPGSGKTQTLLRIIQLLEQEGVKVGGMVTEPIVEKQRRTGFQITNWMTKEHEVFAHEGMKSRVRSGRYGVNLAALDGLVQRQAEVSEHGDHARFAVLDDEFHAALCELAGRPVAWEVAQRVKGHLNRVRRLSLPQPDYLAEMVAEHRLVVEALRKRDPDAAETALRHHLRMVLSALPAIRAQHPDYFEEERA